MKRFVILLCSTLALAGAWAAYRYGRPFWRPLYLHIRGRRTVADALKHYGPEAGARLRAYFEGAGVPYPPPRVVLLVLKKERELELWAMGRGAWTHLHTYPILAASGEPGPKLREGDRQVPEGIYGIEALNPNSSYHLSMKLSYPNAFDSEKARRDGRANVGSDIFIHGKALSIGCVAVGDEAIEELFVLAARTGKAHVKVLIAPNDLRKAPPVTDMSRQPPWLSELYEELGRELRRLGDPVLPEGSSSPGQEAFGLGRTAPTS